MKKRHRKQHHLGSLGTVMSINTQSIDDVLFPKTEAYSKGMLTVSQRHTIAWECSGNPDGIPVIVIHGGPGGGSQPSYRRYFDRNGTSFNSINEVVANQHHMQTSKKIRQCTLFLILKHCASILESIHGMFSEVHGGQHSL